MLVSSHATLMSWAGKEVWKQYSARSCSTTNCIGLINGHSKGEAIMQRITLAVAALTLCTASTVVAQDKLIKIKPNYQANQAKEEAKAKTLTIGDKAPAIDIAHWIKGKKIEEFEADKVYVIEFWATWCGPCVASMPHLSELQKKYADYDVKFISVSDEDLQTVVSFLFKENKKDGKIHNDRTHYTLATDPDE